MKQRSGQLVVERDRLADHSLPAELAPDQLAARFAEPGRASGSARIRSTAAAAADGSPGSNRKPVSPSTTCSGTPPTRVATTGTPAAIASSTVYGRPLVVARQQEARRFGQQLRHVRASLQQPHVVVQARARRRARPSPPRAGRARPGRALPPGTAHGRARVRELRGRVASGRRAARRRRSRPGTTRRGRSNASASIPLWITRYCASLPTPASSPARRSASDTATIARHQCAARRSSASQARERLSRAQNDQACGVNTVALRFPRSAAASRVVNPAFDACACTTSARATRPRSRLRSRASDGLGSLPGANACKVTSVRSASSSHGSDPGGQARSTAQRSGSSPLTRSITCRVTPPSGG